jgi:hypothetical protein
LRLVAIFAIMKEKITKSLLSIFGLIIFLSSCSPLDKGSNSEQIISPKKMVGVFLDMHLAEANLASLPQNDSVIRLVNEYYKFIFDFHETDSATFKRSIAYYSAHPKKMDEIYQQVVDSLTKLEAQEYK